MAQKASKNSSKKSAGKRLSSAKVSASAAPEEKAVSAADRRAERKKRMGQIGIGIFAVLMALSMMLPSLSAIFAGGAQQPAAVDESTSAAISASQATTMEEVDSSYSDLIASLESKLAGDPEDLATLLNLGQDYMNWGYAAQGFATDDAGTSHVNELYGKAIGYFDDYLKLNDSNAVKVDRAMCLLYSGDTSGASTSLEKITTDAPDYAPAWANLGLVYEYTGKSDEATSAYEKAVAADPEDEAGAKSFAERRLEAMKSAEDGSAANVGGTPRDLSDALADASGTNL